jgi:hypothetical protein
MGGCIPAIFYITPYTTHITATQPDKISGPALVKTFTLDGIELFHDWEEHALKVYLEDTRNKNHISTRQ